MSQRDTELAKAEEDNKTLATRLSEEAVFVNQINKDTQDAIRISVRGEKFMTTRTTLCAGGPACMLTPMFAPQSKHTIARDDDDDPFLERNSRRFSSVLNVLRVLKAYPEVVGKGTTVELPLDVGDQLFSLVGSDALRTELQQMGIEIPEILKPKSDLLTSAMRAELLKMFGVKTLKKCRPLFTWIPNQAYPTQNYFINNGPTLTIIKNSNNYVFGAYVDVPNLSSSWVAAGNKSFLFGLGDGATNTKALKLTHNGSGTMLLVSNGISIGQSNELSVFRSGHGSEYCHAGDSGFNWNTAAPGYQKPFDGYSVLCFPSSNSSVYHAQKVEMFAVEV